MGIVLAIIGLILLWGIRSHNINANIKRLDNDPYNSVKSDKWKKEHGTLK